MRRCFRRCVQRSRPERKRLKQYNSVFHTQQQSRRFFKKRRLCCCLPKSCFEKTIHFFPYYIAKLPNRPPTSNSQEKSCGKIRQIAQIASPTFQTFPRPKSTRRSSIAGDSINHTFILREKQEGFPVWYEEKSAIFLYSCKNNRALLKNQPANRNHEAQKVKIVKRKTYKKYSSVFVLE